MKSNIIQEIAKNKIYAIVRTGSSDEALRISEALIAGGINIIEVASEHFSLIKAVKELSAIEGTSVLAGGIITSIQAQEAINANAKMLVSPILQLNLVKLSTCYKIPLMATTTTPNETYKAWKYRVPLTKVFPTQAMGGVLYIKDLLRPMPFLNIVVAGGIRIDNFTDYIKAGVIAVGIGRDFYENLTPAEITKKAKLAISKLQDL